MMLGRPQHIEAEPRRPARQAEIFVPDLIVANILPAVAGEDHHQADIHGTLQSGILILWSLGSPRVQKAGQLSDMRDAVEVMHQCEARLDLLIAQTGMRHQGLILPVYVGPCDTPAARALG